GRPPAPSPTPPWIPTTEPRVAFTHVLHVTDPASDHIAARTGVPTSAAAAPPSASASAQSSASAGAQSSAAPAGAVNRYTAYSVSWNLTQRCNLECAHCYMSAFAGADTRGEL